MLKNFKIVKMLVRSCFLIAVIKCLKGHWSLGLLFNVKKQKVGHSLSHAVSDKVTYWAVRWQLKKAKSLRSLLPSPKYFAEKVCKSQHSTRVSVEDKFMKLSWSPPLQPDPTTPSQTRPCMMVWVTPRQGHVQRGPGRPYILLRETPCPLVSIPQFLPHLTQTHTNLICGSSFFWICWQLFLDLSTKFFGFVDNFFGFVNKFFWICQPNFLNLLEKYANDTIQWLHRYMGHTAWAPEGREGRSQRGPKGRKLEVGSRRAPKLLVSYKTSEAKAV